MHTTSARTAYRVTFPNGSAKTFKSALPIAWALVVEYPTGQVSIWAKSATREGVEAAGRRDAHHLAMTSAVVTVVPVEVTA